MMQSHTRSVNVGKRRRDTCGIILATFILAQSLNLLLYLCFTSSSSYSSSSTFSPLSTARQHHSQAVTDNLNLNSNNMCPPCRCESASNSDGKTEQSLAAAIIPSFTSTTSSNSLITLTYMRTKFSLVAAEFKRMILLHKAVMTLIHDLQPAPVLPGLRALLIPPAVSPVGFTSHADPMRRYEEVKQQCQQQPAATDASGASSTPQLSLATYNLYNIQSDWPLRKVGILAQIKLHNFDVIALQEIRQWQGKNQMEEMLADLRDVGYKYFLYEPVLLPIASDPQSFEEGIGILSKLEITQNVTKVISSPGTSARKVLMAKVIVPKATMSVTVDIFVTHLAVFDEEQCSQIIRVAEFMSSQLDTSSSAISAASPSTSSTGQFLLGDLNVYIDWEWPLDILTHDMLTDHHMKYFVQQNVQHPCGTVWRQHFPHMFVDEGGKGQQEWKRVLYSTSGAAAAASLSAPSSSTILATPSPGAFRDVQTSLYPNRIFNPGRTFPTTIDYRIVDICRPDRILIRSESKWKECDVGVWAYDPMPANPEKLNAVEFLSDHRGVAAIFRWTE